MTPAAVLHLVLCAALFALSCGRLVKTCARCTLPEIRAVFVAQATASIAVIAAIFLDGYQPQWPAQALLTSMVAVQGVTSALWRDGVPESFQRKEG